MILQNHARSGNHFLIGGEGFNPAQAIAHREVYCLVRAEFAQVRVISLRLFCFAEFGDEPDAPIPRAPLPEKL